MKLKNAIDHKDNDEMIIPIREGAKQLADNFILSKGCININKCPSCGRVLGVEELTIPNNIKV